MKSCQNFTRSTRTQNRRECVSAANGSDFAIHRHKLQRGEEGGISKGHVKKCLHNHAWNSTLGGEKTQKNFKEGQVINRFAF